ncbi:hypothetical protein PFICI_12220 [Pestalotiopsis fici W106-1]|uniref:Uncharacterized protein n=1 Tax=Pestalotiopsis fici (strain W106-1 / CGMCC3.15140) TaxID=1229662 RepID=W3WR37_PESFW|nr:uncharacterized protein PFICI_12220 [Pestalotiopsis fici W106-1]ETS75276.1 hypothetical protein PFICI_12220 [Pestalotiopsis fici W106-1]
MVSLSKMVLAWTAGAVARAALSDCFTLQGIRPDGTDLHHVIVTGDNGVFQLFQAKFTTNHTAATKFGIARASSHLVDYTNKRRIANIGLGYDDDFMLFDPEPLLLNRDPLLCGLSKDDGVLSCAAKSDATVHVMVACSGAGPEVFIRVPGPLLEEESNDLIEPCYEATLVASQAEGCVLPLSSTSRTISPASTKSATKYPHPNTTSADHHWQPESTASTTSRHWNIHHSHVTPHQPQRPSIF